MLTVEFRGNLKIGQLVRIVRVCKFLSQAELALCVGVLQAEVSLLEHGHWLSAESRSKILEYLKISNINSEIHSGDVMEVYFG